MEYHDRRGEDAHNVSETQFVHTAVYVAGPAGGAASGADRLVTDLFGSNVGAQILSSAELLPISV